MSEVVYVRLAMRELDAVDKVHAPEGSIGVLHVFPDRESAVDGTGADVIIMEVEARERRE